MAPGRIIVDSGKLNHALFKHFNSFENPDSIDRIEIQNIIKECEVYEHSFAYPARPLREIDMDEARVSQACAMRELEKATGITPDSARDFVQLVSGRWGKTPASRPIDLQDASISHRHATMELSAATGIPHTNATDFVNLILTTPHINTQLAKAETKSHDQKVAEATILRLCEELDRSTERNEVMQKVITKLSKDADPSKLVEQLMDMLLNGN